MQLNVDLMDGWMDGWMDNFRFYILFQQYFSQISRMIMKGSVQWNTFAVEKISGRAGLDVRTARSVGQRLTH